MASTTIRMFGELRAIRRRAGLSEEVVVEIGPGGTSAREIADSLGLPADAIEGVFVNHRVYGLNHRVMPGDAVAFVPPGTPGPHRVFLGLYQAGRSQGT